MGNDNKKGIGAFGAAIIGAVAGAAAVYLSDKKNREKARGKLEEIKSKTDEKINEAKEELEQKKMEGKEKLAEGLDKAQQRIAREKEELKTSSRGTKAKR
jgi:gas vesicle protein